MPNAKPTLAFIGFGEAGQAIAAGLRDAGAGRMSAWDILFPKADGERLLRAGAASGVTCAKSAAEAVRDADIVISAVTAASSVEAAVSVKAHLAEKPFFLDINSVSPGRKQETAKFLATAARYIDVAVLAPIHPARHQTPMLLAGPDAGAVAPTLTALGMHATIGGAEVGAAAAIKMVRSVMIKGIEALTAECFLAAERAGIVEEVKDSMRNNYPTLDWDKVIAYNLERMASHGERRAAEMEEAAETLRELGLDPQMVDATVKRQREMGAIGKSPAVRATLKENHAVMLDAISTAAKQKH
jgi:3-hydroxyisobutyrate dehydrogenase-like beta-hydroxyacid dehydrogenase